MNEFGGTINEENIKNNKPANRAEELYSEMFTGEEDKFLKSYKTLSREVPEKIQNDKLKYNRLSNAISIFEEKYSHDKEKTIRDFEDHLSIELSGLLTSTPAGKRDSDYFKLVEVIKSIIDSTKDFNEFGLNDSDHLSKAKEELKRHLEDIDRDLNLINKKQNK
ncbi:MAG: hypothetical protein HY918_05440 [Candidatus Doudnabacteria bacterium]|nr:hypothetical protein [Candidatus Doudnabacteria bacterium]